MLTIIIILIVIVLWFAISIHSGKKNMSKEEWDYMMAPFKKEAELRRKKNRK